MKVKSLQDLKALQKQLAETQARAAKEAAVRAAAEQKARGVLAPLEAAAFDARLAAAQARIDVLETLEFQILSRLAQGQGAGASASVMKILGTELQQHLTELALEVAG